MTTFARQLKELSLIASGLEQPDGPTLGDLFAHRARLASPCFDELSPYITAAYAHVAILVRDTHERLLATIDVEQNLLTNLTRAVRSSNVLLATPGIERAQAAIDASAGEADRIVYVSNPTGLVDEANGVMAHARVLSPRFKFVAFSDSLAQEFTQSCVFASDAGLLLPTDCAQVFAAAECLIASSQPDTAFRDYQAALDAARAAVL